ncbi:hypothetical protein HY967_03520 [Candidatus Jorgensenbacteria bacterium]|nr:hypothetical protein [Candidatus Jorgensenbacteria bacterium]
MTIIKPNIHLGLRKFIYILFFVLIVGGVVYVFTNNALVDTRHRLQTLKDEFARLRVENADLKNTFYSLTDPSRLEGLAANYGLVLDREPLYLRSNQWLSDSSR